MMINWPTSISTNCCCVDGRYGVEEICKRKALGGRQEGFPEGNLTIGFV